MWRMQTFRFDTHEAQPDESTSNHGCTSCVSNLLIWIYLLGVFSRSSTEISVVNHNEHIPRTRSITSLGYNAPGLRDGSKPAQPSTWLDFCTWNLSGSNSLGLSQKYGDLWRLYTCHRKECRTINTVFDQWDWDQYNGGTKQEKTMK